MDIAKDEDALAFITQHLEPPTHLFCSNVHSLAQRNGPDIGFRLKAEPIASEASSLAQFGTSE